MKYRLTFLFSLFATFSFYGCADLISSLRAESREVEEEAERDRENADTAVGNYRPKPLSGLSANNVPEHDPPAARAYGRRLAARTAQSADMGNEGVHRATREDFVDRVAHENSLWDAQGQSNYLFANNRRRESGDIITADVEKELRREIQYQLWMALPPEQRKTKRTPASAAGAAAGDAVTNAASAAAKVAGEKGPEAKAKDAAEEAAKTNMGSTGKDDDVIRMEVVESMGNGLMRVLGQKRVIYRGVSRVIEVAALVNNKDIDDGNHAKSSAFLDTKAQVIQ